MAEKSESECTEDPNSIGNEQTSADITYILKFACNDLEAGGFIHGEDFNHLTPYTSLNDLHLLATPYSVDEVIEDVAAPIPLSSDSTIDIQRFIDVMDHLLACEATWHGAPNVTPYQTFFSCIYLWSPDRMSSYPLLYSFFGVVMMTYNATVKLKMSTGELDYYHRDSYFKSKVDEHEKSFCSMLQQVEETISHKLKASKKASVHGVEPLQKYPDLEVGFCKAVICRLRFRKYFYHMFTCLRRPQGKGLDLAKRHIKSCLFELDSMLKSEEFLRSCRVSEEGLLEEHNTTASGREPVGFDNLVYPRAIKLFSWKMAVNFFQKFLHELDIICSTPMSPVLESMLRFVVDFYKSPRDSMTSAYLQLLLVQDRRFYGIEPTFAVICKAALLPEHAKKHEIKNQTTVARLGYLLMDSFRALCSNIAAQRSYLPKIIVEWRGILPALEMTFEQRYGDLSSTPLEKNRFAVKICRHILVWTGEQKHWLSLRYLFLGFELGLYSSVDYCMVYWYIYYIQISKIQLKRILNVAKNEIALLKCYTYVVEGLIMILGILMKIHNVFTKKGEKRRFNQLFGELEIVGGYWRDVSYTNFKNRPPSPAINECRSFIKALDIAAELRVNFADDPYILAEVCKIEQVAKSNAEALNLISQLSTTEPSVSISFEFVHHPHYAVTVVKKVQSSTTSTV